MITRMYSVHDKKAECYTQPFHAHTDGMAKRTFTDLVLDPNHIFGKHPHDFTLFMVGTYNDQTGKTEPITPISLGNGVEFNQPQLPLSE